MRALDGLRAALRGLSWTLAIGMVAAFLNAGVVVALASIWPAADFARAAVLAMVQALVVFALTSLAGLVIQLEPWAGGLSGLWSAALPAAVVLSLEGPLGLAPQWGMRVAGAAMAASAGLLGASIHRRRQPAERTGSGPPSAPIS